MCCKEGSCTWETSFILKLCNVIYFCNLRLSIFTYFSPQRFYIFTCYVKRQHLFKKPPFPHTLLPWEEQHFRNFQGCEPSSHYRRIFDQNFSYPRMSHRGGARGPHALSTTSTPMCMLHPFCEVFP